MSESALKQVFATFTFDADSGELRRIEADVGKTAAKIGKTIQGTEAKATGLLAGLETLGAGLTGILAGIGLVHWTNELAATLDELDDLSAQTGVAVDQLQELDYFATVNGSSAEEMRGAVSRLQIALGNAAEGGKAQAAALEKMGIALKDTSGHTRGLNELLPDILDNFGSIADEGEQAAAAQALFGRAGVKMLPVLKQGKEGIAKLRAEFEALGGGATVEATAAAGAYRDSLARLDVALFGLKSRVATAVFPQLEKLTNGAARLIGNFDAWAQNTTLVTNGVEVLAATVGLKLGTALAPYLKAGLKFAGIFLAIDDVLAFLSGKDSVIGDLLNRAFGDGTATQVRAWANDAADALAGFAKSAEATFEEIDSANQSTWRTAAAALVGFFRDAANGFPVFRAAFKANLAEIELDFDAGVLHLEQRWNEFLGALHLPKFLETALSINTDDAVERVAAADHASFNANNALMLAKQNEDAGNRAAIADARQFRSAAVPRDDSGARLAIGSNAIHSLAARLPNAMAPGVAAIPYGVPLRPEAGYTNYVEVNYTTQVTVPLGTSRQQAADVAAAAKSGASRANLAALERTK